MQKSAKIIDPEQLFFKSPLKGTDGDNFTFDLEKIKRCLNILATKDTSCIIFGDRGVGKTSFAWQIVSILKDEHKKYKQKDLLVVGKDKKFKTIFFKCNSLINNVSELLLNILRPSPDPYSFSKIFSELYEDKTYQAKFKAKFKFDLLALLNVELGYEETEYDSNLKSGKTYQILTSSNKIQNLFIDVIAEIKVNYPNTEIILVIDEIDQIQKKDGLGSFIKNAGDVKFAFVGIAEAVSDIISDHLSAGRKLIGGDIEMERLTDNQIEWIFRSAEQRSNGGVEFDPGFVAKAVKYSNGFPWIAQNLGYSSLFTRLLKGVPAGQAITIYEKDFEPALHEVIRLYKMEANNTLDFDAATNTNIQVKVLQLIWDLSTHPTSEQLRIALEKDGRHIATALNRLKESRIISMTQVGRYKFVDPTVRILTKYLLDNIKMNRQNAE